MSYIGAEPDGMGKAQRFTYTSASGGETVVSADDAGVPIGYTSGQVSVFLNGVKLVVGTDCIATNGSTITGLSALAASDVVEVVALSIFSATTVEGADIISTGVTGTTKYLRVDGDGTSSWQTVTIPTDFVSAASGGTFSGAVTAPSIVLTPGSAPGSPAEGAIYYDSTSDTVKVYNGTSWISLSNIATGGTITSYSGYIVHTFLTSGTFTVHTMTGTVDYLVVAGGGSGGSAGGGGAGGIRYATGYSMATGVHTITIGAGGTPLADTSQAKGNNGVNTSLGSIIATGGGGGGKYHTSSDTAGLAGGSGGGGGWVAGAGGTGINDGGTFGTVTFQGYAGGTSVDTSTQPYTSAGGGGGGALGLADSGSVSGAGGTGFVSSINGTSLSWAGGGGGGSQYSTSTAGAGGAGGGGGGCGAASGTGGAAGGSALNAGIAGTPTKGGNGGANTGGGGGGLGITTGSGGSGTGGSGIVIIRYAI